MGASKGQTETLIENAIEGGLTLFGENRVGEALEKWVSIKKRHPQIELHLIGPLQSNKVKDALSLFDVIESLDRTSLVDAIAKANPGKTRFLVQVNTGKELQKSGVIPEEADQLITYAKKLGLNVVGLMCVPPVDQPSAPHFALLHSIAKRHGLSELSMGMSGDFETAARMGSSCVRIGTTLFGERESRA